MALPPVNAAKIAPVNTHQCNAFMRYGANGDGGPNYSLESLAGPAPDSEATPPPVAAPGVSERQLS